ncbi:MAG: site-specific integrase [Lachnospiraceae bacterium]|nr:site-specific integrase [Lachnospiraceae bacterium]
MGRRGENIRRRKDGRWEARVVQGSPVNGRTNYKFLYGKTYQEAKSLKKAYYLALETGRVAYNAEYSIRSTDQLTGSSDNSHLTGNHNAIQLPGNPAALQPTGSPAAAQTPPAPAPSPLFRDATEGWLNSKKAVVKDSSFSYYTLMVRNHILPALGDLPLAEITPQRLSAFLMAQKAGGSVKTGRPMKDKTVADLKGIVKQILSWASLHDMIETAPPCPAVQVRQSPTAVFTRQEQSLLEAQLLKEDTPFCLGVWLTLYGGPRIGEVCALKWEDINFQNGTVQIKKTVSRIADVDGGAATGTKLIISSPKTECSMRSIPLPETILSYLNKRRKPGPRYVITGTSHFMEPRTCLARFKRLLKRAGVAEHTWHALRHTFATRCIESGVDVKSLSEIMGHSDVKVTMQRYVHPSMDAKKYQVNKLTCGMDFRNADRETDILRTWKSGQISGQNSQEISPVSGQKSGQSN